MAKSSEKAKPSAPAIVSKWRRWMAVGCSHGAMIDPEAEKYVLDFADRFKAQTRLHLGDWTDFAGFRGGARSCPDSSDFNDDIRYDFNRGKEFLLAFRPQYVFIGNHEDRVYELAESPNGVLRYAAQTVIGEIEDIARKIRARIIPYGFDEENTATLGDTKFLHGCLYGVNAIRDTAESHGRCVMAHIHRTGHERGRRVDRPSGYAVGMLKSFDSSKYAKSRRATLAWSQGLAFGEYNDKHCSVTIIERNKNHTWPKII